MVDVDYVANACGSDEPSNHSSDLEGRAPRPKASSVDASRRMKAVRRRDTVPELALRRALRARGMGYRVDVPPVTSSRRRADIVFARARVAILVHGCFWHRCPDHGTTPKSSTAWWNAKFDANRARDADTVATLERSGWRVIVVWEHDDPEQAADRIVEVVEARRSAMPRRQA